MNTHKIGLVYHVVDKTTGSVVKVGSTITTLACRWKYYNKNKFSNHYLKEVHRIVSSELDWYEKGNSRCPFLWHLIASEHLEIIKQGTWKKGKLSNQVSPLDQKYFGYCDAHLDTARMGALNQSREDKARGGYIQGPIQGKKNLESGLWARVVSLGGRASGKSKSLAKLAANAKNGGRFGRWSVESGHLADLRTPEHQSRAGKAGGRKGGPAANHLRWHVKRNIVNQNCSLCKGKDASSPTSNS